MLRTIIASLVFAAFTSTVATAQPLPKDWADWLTQNRPHVAQSEQALSFWVQRKNQAKTDCVSRIGTVVSQLTWERNQLRGMVDALDKLPADEAISLIYTVNPIYQNSVASTNALMKKVDEHCPVQQASIQK